MTARALRTAAWASLLACLSGCRLSDPDQTHQPAYKPVWLVPGEEMYIGLAGDWELEAVDLKTGARAWRIELSPIPNPLEPAHQHLACVPAFVGPKMVLREEQELLILQTDVGRPTHREAAERESQFGGRCCPAALDGETYVALRDAGRRLTRSRADGTEVWSVEMPGGSVAVSPARVLGNGDIAVRTTDRVTVWSAEGRMRWGKEMEGYRE